MTLVKGGEQADASFRLRGERALEEMHAEIFDDKGVCVLACDYLFEDSLIHFREV
jgi:hypothetical protein